MMSMRLEMIRVLSSTGLIIFIMDREMPRGHPMNSMYTELEEPPIVVVFLDQLYLVLQVVQSGLFLAGLHNHL